MHVSKNSHLELIPSPQYDGFTGNSRRKSIFFIIYFYFLFFYYLFFLNINSPFFRINLTIFPPSHYTPAYVVIFLKKYPTYSLTLY